MLSLTNEVLVSTAGATSRLARAADSLGRPAGYSLRLGGTTSASSVSYGFDSLGRFSQVGWTMGGNTRTALYSYVVNSDLVAGYDVPAGTNTFCARRTFEPQRDLIVSVSNTFVSSVPFVVNSFRYENDEIARRMRRLDNNSVTNTFGYNGRSELTSALMGTNVFRWAFDPIGNRIAYTNNADVLRYTANELNQYTQITNGGLKTLAYDLDGNLTNDSERAYFWDAENRLTRVEPRNPATGAKRVRSAYDYRFRRIEKAVDTWNGSAWVAAATNRFTWHDWALVAEIEQGVSSSATTNVYVWGLDLSGTLQGAGTIGGLLAISRNGTNALSFADANGNITDLIDAALPTNVLAHYEWDAYGKPLAASGPWVAANPLRWSSKYWDQETGLGYWGYRWFNGERWMSRDPVEEEGGLHLYAFCRNSPVFLFDPRGMRVTVIVGGTPPEVEKLIAGNQRVFNDKILPRVQNKLRWLDWIKSRKLENTYKYYFDGVEVKGGYDEFRSRVEREKDLVQESAPFATLDGDIATLREVLGRTDRYEGDAVVYNHHGTALNSPVAYIVQYTEANQTSLDDVSAKVKALGEKTGRQLLHAACFIDPTKRVMKGLTFDLPEALEYESFEVLEGGIPSVTKKKGYSRPFPAHPCWEAWGSTRPRLVDLP
jgi:RHS repeat-associated protein